MPETDPVDPETEGSPTEPPARRPFAAWLQEQRRGGLHADLSEKLGDLSAAVIETGKKGSLTLQIVIVANGVDQVKVLDKVVVKEPVVDNAESFFFVDAKGNLNRSDPRQPQLPLNEIEARRGA